MNSQADRMCLLRCMLGSDARSGLCVVNKRDISCYTPGRSSSITAPKVQCMKDYWCCGAYRPTVTATVACDQPAHGWLELGEPNFNDYEPHVDGREARFDGPHAEKWRRIQVGVSRCAEHGFWSVYWCPTRERSFCHDKRDIIFERYFWLPQ